MPMPVLIVVCCACEGVKVPPLELTIEEAGVLAQTHSDRDASRLLETKEDLPGWNGHRLRKLNGTVWGRGGLVLSRARQVERVGGWLDDFGRLTFPLAPTRST